MIENILAYYDKEHEHSIEEFERVLKENGISLRRKDGTLRDFCDVLNDLGELWKQMNYEK